jgi:hypothetical protein
MQRWFVIFLLFPAALNAQIELQRKIGFNTSFGVSNARLKNGTAIAYPGPPFWSGNLKVRESAHDSFGIEVWQERVLKRNFTTQVTLGYTFRKFGVNYDYDYANSINNIVRQQRTFHYGQLSKRLAYQLQLGKCFSVSPTIGLFVGYLLKSQSVSSNYLSGVVVTTQTETTSKENRVNYGYEMALSFRWQGQNYAYELRPFFIDYRKSMYGDMNRIVYAWGLGVGLVKPILKKSPNTPR